MLDFPFALGSSASVSAALWMTVASIGASLLLLLYTLELRLRRRLRERRRASVIAHWRAVIADAVTGAEEPAKQKLRRSERQEFLRLWVYTRSMVEGAAADRLIALARRLGLPDFVRKRMSNAHVGVRLMAIQAQGYLRDPASFADLAAATDDANALVSVTTAEALVAIDANRAAARLIPKISSRRDWPRTHVFKVLQRAGSAVVGEPLYRCIRAAADEDAAYLLQFAEIAEFDVRDALAVEFGAADAAHPPQGSLSRHGLFVGAPFRQSREDICHAQNRRLHRDLIPRQPDRVPRTIGTLMVGGDDIGDLPNAIVVGVVTYVEDLAANGVLGSFQYADDCLANVRDVHERAPWRAVARHCDSLCGPCEAGEVVQHDVEAHARRRAVGGGIS